MQVFLCPENPFSMMDKREKTVEDILKEMYNKFGV